MTGKTGRSMRSSDRLRISVSEKEFWAALWKQAPFSMWEECGLDMVRFGPIWAACLADDPCELGLNVILGGGEVGAVEHGHLADAVAWLESRPQPSWGGSLPEVFGVDYRVPIIPGLPGSASAERWLRERGATREPGPIKLARDTSPPRFDSPAGIEVLDWNDWDDWFIELLTESLRLPSCATSLFSSLLTDDNESWRCYGAVGAGEPLAYAAMHLDSGVATLALASRPSEFRDGVGQVALLNRCIQKAAAAGCDMIVVIDAGHGPAMIDRESLVQVGFEVAFQTPIWHSRVEVEA